MPAPDLSRLDSPLGPLRDKRTVTVGTDDLEFPEGVIVQVATTAGTNALIYRTLHGAADQTETGLSAGDTINVGGVPVLIRIIRGASTVTGVVVGVV